MKNCGKSKSETVTTPAFSICRMNQPIPTKHVSEKNCKKKNNYDDNNNDLTNNSKRAR